MDLFPKKEKDKDIEDSIKILSTNLEVINQRLANISGGGGGGTDPDAMKQISDDVTTQVGFIQNFLKSSQTHLQQQMNYVLTQLKALDTSVKHVENGLKQHITSEKNALLQETRSEIEKSVNFSSNILKEIDSLKQGGLTLSEDDLPKGAKTANALTVAMRKELDLFTGRFLQNMAKSDVFSEALVKEFGYVKADLQKRFIELTESNLKLLEINKELLQYFRKYGIGKTVTDGNR